MTLSLFDASSLILPLYLQSYWSLRNNDIIFLMSIATLAGGGGSKQSMFFPHWFVLVACLFSDPERQVYLSRLVMHRQQTDRCPEDQKPLISAHYTNNRFISDRLSYSLAESCLAIVLRYVFDRIAVTGRYVTWSK